MLTLEQKRRIMQLDPGQFTAPAPRDRSELWVSIGCFVFSLAVLIVLLWKL